MDSAWKIGPITYFECHFEGNQPFLISILSQMGKLNRGRAGVEIFGQKLKSRYASPVLGCRIRGSAVAVTQISEV